MAVDNNNLKDRVRRLEEDVRTLDKSQTERYHSLKAGVEAIGLLTDHQRRAEASLVEHDDRLTALERIASSVQEAANRYDRRLDALEGMNIALLADRLKRVERLLAWLLAAIGTLIFSVLGGIIIFLVTQRGA